MTSGTGREREAYVRVALDAQWRERYEEEKIPYKHTAALFENQNIRFEKQYYSLHTPDCVDTRKFLTRCRILGLRLVDVYLAFNHEGSKLPTFLVGELRNHRSHEDVNAVHVALFERALDGAFMRFDARTYMQGNLVQEWITLGKRRGIEGSREPVWTRSGWDVVHKPALSDGDSYKELAIA
jgi:hypothetical protein